MVPFAHQVRYIFFITVVSVFFIFSPCGIISVPAQDIGDVAGQRVELRPSEYEFPFAPGQVLCKNNNPMRPDGGNLWIVYSDRDDNLTYTGPNRSTSVYKKASFMESFYVIDETCDFIRIVKWGYDVLSNRRNANRIKLLSTAEDFGWVPKENMLLWNSCLVNQNTKFALKALTVHTVETMRAPERYFKGESLLKVFSDPELGLNNANKNFLKLFQFLFLYKETADSYLVGKSEVIIPGDAQNEIIGWISKDVISIWNRRLTLEPNWDPVAISERKKKAIKASILDKLDHTKSFFNDLQTNVIENNPHVIWQDYYENRKEAYMKRFPILNEYSDGFYQVGFVTDVLDGKGDTLLKGAEFEEADRIYNEKKDKYRNINIVFAIDGTTSMGPYFSSIVGALDSSFNFFEQDKKNSYKLGAVVYRDYPEEGCNKAHRPDRLADIQELTSNIAKLKNFLNDLSLPDECTDYCDRDAPEALYYGLFQAASMLNRYPNETSVLVLIGDAGNRKEDIRDKRYDSEILAKIFSKIECNFLIYQVRNVNASTYDDFIYQTVDIVKKSGQLMNDNLEKEKFQKVRKDYKSKIVPIPDIFARYELKGSPVVGRIIHPDKGSSLKVRLLEQEIRSMLKEQDSLHNGYLADADLVRERSLEEVGGVDLPVLSILKRFIPNRKIRHILTEREKYMLFITGFTGQRHWQLNEPMYKYVLFLTDQEYLNLIFNINKVYINDGSKSTQRERIENAFRELVITYYGKQEARKVLKEKSVAEIWKYITDIPTNQNSCPWPARVSDFNNPNFNVDKLVRCLKRKVSSLDNFINDNSGFAKFRSSDRTFYWIPQDYMP